MKVKIKFFSGIKFNIGLTEIEMELPEKITIKDLVDILILEYKEKAKKALLYKDSYKFLLFVNMKKIKASGEYIIRDNDIIYFMSPITGG